MDSERTNRILAFEMRSHIVFKVCWKDKVSNDSVRKTLSRQITLADVTKRRKLQLFGHICRLRDKRQLKTVMLGMTDGNRPHGRPARWWSDDISDCCNCNLTEAIRLAIDKRMWQTKVNAITGLNGS